MRQQMEILSGVKEPLVDFFKLLAMLMYVFAVFGMELLHSSPLFADVSATLTTLLQLANQENWPGTCSHALYLPHCSTHSLFSLPYLLSVSCRGCAVCTQRLWRAQFNTCRLAGLQCTSSHTSSL